jgi:hypothetical protein
MMNQILSEPRMMKTMIKMTVGALLILVFPVLTFGSQSSDEWVKFTSKEGRYSVLLPKEPTLSTETISAATGECRSMQHCRRSVTAYSMFPIPIIYRT